VPYSAGSGADITARQTMAKLSILMQSDAKPGHLLNAIGNLKPQETSSSSASSSRFPFIPGASIMLSMVSIPGRAGGFRL
jgi:hypothetical protein